MSTTPITAEDNHTIPFIRSFIRVDDSPEEFLKAQNGCYWLLSNLNNIKPYFTPCDFALLQRRSSAHCSNHFDRTLCAKIRAGIPEGTILSMPSSAGASTAKSRLKRLRTPRRYLPAAYREISRIIDDRPGRMRLRVYPVGPEAVA